MVQVTYKDSITEIDSFELTVNNWDPVAAAFKYVGAETAESLREDTPQSRLQRLFEPSRKRVEVWMGYLDDMRLMVTGHFTTMEPSFPSSGGPTLTVRGLNVLHELRRKKYTNTWPHGKRSQVQDSQIAKEIDDLRDNGQEAISPPHRHRGGRAEERAVTRLRGPAQPVRHRFSALPRPAARLRRLRQGARRPESQAAPLLRAIGGRPGARPADVTYELEWGRSLIEFKPTLTTATQVAAVTVTGWNRRTKQPIRAKVTLADQSDPLQPGPVRAARAGEECAREEQVVNEPVYTESQARQRAGRS